MYMHVHIDVALSYNVRIVCSTCMSIRALWSLHMVVCHSWLYMYMQGHVLPLSLANTTHTQSRSLFSLHSLSVETTPHNSPFPSRNITLLFLLKPPTYIITMSVSHPRQACPAMGIWSEATAFPPDKWSERLHRSSHYTLSPLSIRVSTYSIKYMSDTIHTCSHPN